MDTQTISNRVKKIVLEQLGVYENQVTPEARFIEDLGADSLDGVELVMAIEEEFDIEIPDEDFEDKADTMTVGDVVKYLEERLK